MSNHRRPRLPLTERRLRLVGSHVTDAEADQIEALAERRGQTVSALLRGLALAAATDDAADGGTAA
jgi:hypothetical protein